MVAVLQRAAAATRPARPEHRDPRSGTAAPAAMSSANVVLPTPPGPVTRSAVRHPAAQHRQRGGDRRRLAARAEAARSRSGGGLGLAARRPALRRRGARPRLRRSAAASSRRSSAARRGRAGAPRRRPGRAARGCSACRASRLAGASRGRLPRSPRVRSPPRASGSACLARAASRPWPSPAGRRRPRSRTRAGFAPRRVGRGASAARAAGVRVGRRRVHRSAWPPARARMRAVGARARSRAHLGPEHRLDLRRDLAPGLVARPARSRPRRLAERPADPGATAVAVIPAAAIAVRAVEACPSRRRVRGSGSAKRDGVLPRPPPKRSRSSAAAYAPPRPRPDAAPAAAAVALAALGQQVLGDRRLVEVLVVLDDRGATRACRCTAICDPRPTRTSTPSAASSAAAAPRRPRRLDVSGADRPARRRRGDDCPPPAALATATPAAPAATAAAPSARVRPRPARRPRRPRPPTRSPSHSSSAIRRRGRSSASRSGRSPPAPVAPARESFSPGRTTIGASDASRRLGRVVALARAATPVRARLRAVDVVAVDAVRRVRPRPPRDRSPVPSDCLSGTSVIDRSSSSPRRGGRSGTSPSRPSRSG